MIRRNVGRRDEAWLTCGSVRRGLFGFVLRFQFVDGARRRRMRLTFRSRDDAESTLACLTDVWERHVGLGTVSQPAGQVTA